MSPLLVISVILGLVILFLALSLFRMIRTLCAVWLSGNAKASINVGCATARLVPRWVTVCGRANHLGMKGATQVNSAFYPS